jgi:hypothetical protein
MCAGDGVEVADGMNFLLDGPGGGAGGEQGPSSATTLLG